MVLTEETMTLPTIEELTVPEVNLSTTTLRSASFHLGKYCETKNNVGLCSFYALPPFFVFAVLLLNSKRLHNIICHLTS